MFYIQAALGFQFVENITRDLIFITSHDGFDLTDLVSYEQRHNEANGENNQDGHADSHSWNCGTEGRSVLILVSSRS